MATISCIHKCWHLIVWTQTLTEDQLGCDDWCWKVPEKPLVCWHSLNKPPVVYGSASGIALRGLTWARKYNENGTERQKVERFFRTWSWRSSWQNVQYATKDLFVKGRLEKLNNFLKLCCCTQRQMIIEFLYMTMEKLSVEYWAFCVMITSLITISV